MREFLAVLNALSEPNRLRLLLRLHERELCVCNLVDFIGLADSTVSKHMSILKQAGLVESRKKGRWVYYRLADRDASPLVEAAIQFACDHLRSDKTVLADAAKMADVLGKDDGTKCQPVTDSCTAHEPIETLESA